MPHFKFRFAGPLSLLLVAALVFAPGEHRLGGAETTQRDSGDIAARMLAPTLDQGLSGKGRFGRVDLSSRERERRGIERFWVGALLLAAFCLAAASRSFLIVGFAAKSRPEHLAHAPIRRRGPPLLQPA
jgi:hypothetical protein